VFFLPTASLIFGVFFAVFSLVCFGLSVPVQVIFWKDSSPKWPVICQVGYKIYSWTAPSMWQIDVSNASVDGCRAQSWSCRCGGSCCIAKRRCCWAPNLRTARLCSRAIFIIYSHPHKNFKRNCA